MLYIGIDLAERHSAAVALDDDLTVLVETSIDAGPAEPHPYGKVAAYTKWWWEIHRGILSGTVGVPDQCDYVIEEPYPHAVKVAPAYRIQGAILAAMQEAKIPQERVRVTLAKAWQDYYGYTKKEFGNPKAWARLMCEAFGYEPGEATGQKFKAKPKEDLRDAYMLARWLKETL